MASKAKQIFTQPNEKKYKLYEGLVDELVTTKAVDELLELVQHLVRTEGDDQYGRTYITPEIMMLLVKKMDPDKSDIKADDMIDIEDLLPLMEKLIPIFRERGEDFPDPLMEAIDLLARMYQAEEEWQKAAFALTSFKFDKYRHCSASTARKVEWLVETSEFWLECDETGSASQQIKKAHALINNDSELKANLLLSIRFKTCYARVLDAERKFLEAAMHYKQLSQFGQSVIGEADMLKTLECAAACAILAQAGPSRSRVLAILYSDERAQSLLNYSLLEKVFKERIIREQEVREFEKRLMPHQNAQTSNGMTVLQNSIVEHNMLATSKLYNNIQFEQLAVLLGISPVAAEKLASTMIEQGRMKAVIDQVEGVVEFSEGGEGSLATWDSQIQELCRGVNKVLEGINVKYPEQGYVF